MADQHQQDFNDELRIEGGGPAGRLALGEALLADRGEQEGAHGHVEQCGEFLGGEAVGGFAEQALDGLCEGAVAGEVGVAEGEEAEAVEASGVAEGVEAAVVVVAAEVGERAVVRRETWPRASWS